MTNPYEILVRETDDQTSGSAGQRILFATSILGIAAAVLLTLAIYIAARPAVNRSLLNKLTVGMTKQEVSSILGQPSQSYGSSEWHYWRWGNSGWVEIAFDGSDCVTYINDESAFR